MITWQECRPEVPSTCARGKASDSRLKFMARIVIIGGGIAGLSAAYDLNRDGRHQVTLIESSDRLGGKILTHHVDGLTIEGGPDSIFTSKPWAVELMTELG